MSGVQISPPGPVYGNRIRKSAGILIKNRKLLVERSKNKTHYIAPGGSIEDGETSKQALRRELKEEFNIETNEKDFEKFGNFSAKAAAQEHRIVYMDVFLVKEWVGEPVPSAEVEEILWVNSKLPKDIQVGSIFEHEVIPRLKKQKLID